MSTKLTWGILGTGRIAGTFAEGLARSRTGTLVSVASRDQAKANAFASKHGAAHAHGTYEALLDDPDVAAVYIATPHPAHVEWAEKAAARGKHVLCEKPVGLNLVEARAAIEACRLTGVLFMEAYMYRCHPQTVRIAELVRSGALGKVGLIQGTFSFQRPYLPNHRLYDKKLGGGGILDVGGYPVSMARLVAGAAANRPFLNPHHVDGAGYLHPESGVDVYAAATLGFANDIVAQVSAGIGLRQESVVRIYGSEGWLLVPDPFVVGIDGGESSLLLHRNGATEPERIVVHAGPLYAMEADAFADALWAGLSEVPVMSPADTLGNMDTLDRWRAAIGLHYPGEGRPSSGGS